MSFLSRFFPRQPVIETKKSRAYALHFSPAASPDWMKREFVSFAKEAYQQNVVAYQAINKLATAVSMIEWEAWQGDKEIGNHPILNLLRRPNPLQSGSDWWKMRVAYLLIAGSCYDERVSDSRESGISELWPLRPDRVTIRRGMSGMPAEFIYSVNSKKVIFGADEVTGDSDILHTKMFHPTDEQYGLSPVEAAAYAVDQHNATMTWIQSLLRNSARPSGALVMDSEVSLSDEEFNRLQTEVEAKYSGAVNAGRPMLLEGGLKWQQMGLSPVDMEILRIKDSSARDISLAFGVPPLLLNIPGDNTYANYREARLGFYEDTVLPFVNFLAAGLSSWLRIYYPDLELKPNKDKIEAIADKRTKLWEMADASDDLTLNESRELKGFPPLPAPLGNKLMSEIRAMQKQPAEPSADAVKRFVYGNG